MPGQRGKPGPKGNKATCSVLFQTAGPTPKLIKGILPSNILGTFEDLTMAPLLSNIRNSNPVSTVLTQVFAAFSIVATKDKLHLKNLVHIPLDCVLHTS